MKDFNSVECNFDSGNRVVLTSGECDCVFRLRVCSIENVFKILESVLPDVKNET